MRRRRRDVERLVPVGNVEMELAQNVHAQCEPRLITGLRVRIPIEMNLRIVDRHAPELKSLEGIVVGGNVLYTIDENAFGHFQVRVVIGKTEERLGGIETHVRLT